MILSVSNLNAGYGRIPILHNVSLEVAAGECLGIWGHNGMGKTTLLRAIQGHLPATSGEITFESEAVASLPAHKRARVGISMVPQGRQIFPGLTVLENLRMGSAILASDDDDISEMVLELFPRLKRLLNRTGGLLSGGEQQLLALARCLCGKPKLVMLDEPTEGIQPSINEEIAETLATLREKQKLTLILVEQRRDFIAALADRILIMQKGEIKEQMSAKDLLELEEIL
ncbi:MAG: ABC transporter ATP-binding protein [Pseudomonadota bacterium]